MYVLDKEDQVMVHLEHTFTLKLGGDNAALFLFLFACRELFFLLFETAYNPLITLCLT